MAADIDYTQLASAVADEIVSRLITLVSGGTASPFVGGDTEPEADKGITEGDRYDAMTLKAIRQEAIDREFDEDIVKTADQKTIADALRAEDRELAASGGDEDSTPEAAAEEEIEQYDRAEMESWSPKETKDYAVDTLGIEVPARSRQNTIIDLIEARYAELNGVDADSEEAPEEDSDIDPEAVEDTDEGDEAVAEDDESGTNSLGYTRDEYLADGLDSLMAQAVEQGYDEASLEGYDVDALADLLMTV